MTRIETTLAFLAGDKSNLEALRDPHSEESKTLEALQAVTRRMHEVDVPTLARSVLEDEFGGGTT